LDAVRSAEAEFKQTKEFSEARESIIALRPKLAYAAGREERVRPLMNVLNPAMKSGAQSPEKFKYLVRLIEGIIAYHKFYGGGN
jgi:CRISPR-associated protein Csm2